MFVHRVDQSSTALPHLLWQWPMIQKPAMIQAESLLALSRLVLDPQVTSSCSHLLG